MVAVDSLVHNFLHRTGLLAVFNRQHGYGAACYGDKGCEGAILVLSGIIDARSINPDYPPVFPRLVQLAIWRFCSEGGLDLCNGRRIDDGLACGRTDCPLGTRCSRQPLRPDPVVLVELVR
jgi:hypothetical protein